MWVRVRICVFVEVSPDGCSCPSLCHQSGPAVMRQCSVLADKGVFSHSDMGEWQKLIAHDSGCRAEQRLERGAASHSRWCGLIRIAATRGSACYTEHPLVARSRGVAAGSNGQHIILGELETNALHDVCRQSRNTSDVRVACRLSSWARRRRLRLP